jgi:hypothetical protein
VNEFVVGSTAWRRLNEGTCKQASHVLSITRWSYLSTIMPPLLSPAPRISQLLPSVKCSNCNFSVPLSDLGDHVCSKSQPSVSAASLLPSRLKDRVASPPSRPGSAHEQHRSATLHLSIDSKSTLHPWPHINRNQALWPVPSLITLPLYRVPSVSNLPYASARLHP